jgi:hypothetical protein
MGYKMDYYHFNANIISRGDGGSVAAAAAYISGEKIRDAYDGKIHDRSYRQDITHKEILLPFEAPRELLDRQTLFDELNASEKWDTAQMARIITIALSITLLSELSFEKYVALVNEFISENFISAGLCADVAFHKGLLDKSRKPKGIESVHERKENPHAHLIVPFRPIDKHGFHRTKTQTRYMNNRAFLIFLRKDWARLQNREFERLGLDVRVSHESLAAQGIDREPTKHIGAAAMALELRGIQTERGDEYRETMKRNIEREMTREMARERRLERERTFERTR